MGIGEIKNTLRPSRILNFVIEELANIFIIAYTSVVPVFISNTSVHHTFFSVLKPYFNIFLNDHFPCLPFVCKIPT